MKKLIIVALLLALTVTTQAQDAQIQHIRKLYNQTKDIVDHGNPALPPEHPHNETIVTNQYMAPGAGPIRDVVHYYYSGDHDPEIDATIYKPYFISRKHNDGYWKYYEEFLFEKDNLVFYYCKRTGEDEVDEYRYYWGPEGFLKSDVKGSISMDEVFTARLANDLIEAFNKLMNRDY